MNINERIKLLRKTMALTQSDFGKRIGVTRGVITNIEFEKTEPKPLQIDLICREFGVSEKWLRYGEGEMFVNTTRSEEIAGFVGEVLSEEDETFKKRFISILSKLNEDEWKLLEKMALSMVDEVVDKSSDRTKSIDYTTTPHISKVIAARGGGVYEMSDEEYKQRKAEVASAREVTEDDGI